MLVWRVPTISVLMALNQETDAKPLSLSLESIYEKQNIQPNEVVLASSGELTAELSEVVKTFKKGKARKVRVFELEAGSTNGACLKPGIESCTGEHIMFTEPYAISVNNRFELQQAFFINDPKLEVYGGFLNEFEDNPKAPPGTAIHNSRSCSRNW